MRVLIVDDERRTREGIRKHVNWQRWGAGEVLTAGDGQAAFDLIQMRPVDIVICDIRMPRMDGIRLAQHLYEMQPDCRVIFLSGYADKQYLFSAIRLHAVAYVEKPFEIAEMEAALDEAVRQIHARGPAHPPPREVHGQRVALALELAAPGEKDMQSLAARLRQAGIDTSGAQLTSAVLALSAPPEGLETSRVQREQSLMTLVSRFNAPSHNDLLCARAGDGLVMHLVTRPQQALWLVPWLVETAGQLAGRDCRVTAGVGDASASLAGAPRSYRQALEALERTHFTQQKIAYYAQLGALKPYRPDPLRVKDIASAVALGDETGARQALAAWEQEMACCSLSWRAACDSALRILNALPGDDPAADAASVRACGQIQELNALLQARIAQRTEKNSLYGGGNRTVREVMRVIRAEYANPRLNIALIAQRVYLTPNYLCAVVKKETGRTINAYIAQYRVTVAGQMLQDPSLHVYEIAVRCGFGSVENFTRIFKKLRGVLPSVQRKSL